MVSSPRQLTTLDSLLTVLERTTKIELNTPDVPDMICTECLIKVDLIHTLQSQFAAQDATYRSLQNARTTCQLEVVEAVVQDDYGENKLEPLEEDDLEDDFDVDDGSNYSEESPPEEKSRKKKRPRKAVKLSSLIARKC